MRAEHRRQALATPTPTPTPEVVVLEDGTVVRRLLGLAYNLASNPATLAAFSAAAAFAFALGGLRLSRGVRPVVPTSMVGVAISSVCTQKLVQHCFPFR
jgi:hypothetical protein